MNIFEAILTRRSWRTYNGLRLDENTILQVESIISAANAAASEPLTRDAAVPAPRVVLLEDESLNGLSGTYGAIRGARHFMALISTSSEGAQIDAGALMENIIISLTAMASIPAGSAAHSHARDSAPLPRSPTARKSWRYRPWDTAPPPRGSPSA